MAPKKTQTKKIKPQTGDLEFHLFFKSNPTPMWIYDLETLAFLQVNDAAIEKYGYTQAEFKKLTIKDIRPAEDVPALLENFNLQRSALQHSGQWRHQLKNGQVIDVEITSHTMEFEGWNSVFVMAQDITEQKLAEEALYESEARYRDLVENSHDLICTHDLAGNLLSVNDAAVRLTGYSREALLKMNLRDGLAPGTRQEGFESYLKIIQKTGHANGEMNIVNARGEIRIWEYNNTLRTEGVEKPIVRGLARDVTERKKMEEDLKKSEERYRSISEDMPAMICRFKHDGTLTFINSFYCEYFNMRHEDLIGKNLFQLISEEEKEFVKSKYLSLNHEKPYITYEYKNTNPDGRVVWQRWTDRALFNEKGEIIEFQSLGEDITENKQAELFAQSTIDALSAHICVLDKKGQIISVNRAWREFADTNPPVLKNYAIGMNYLQVAEKAANSNEEGTFEFTSNLKEVLAGSLNSFTSEYPCHSPKEKRWFISRVTKFEEGESFRIVIAHENITTQKLFEETLRASEVRFSNAFENAPIGMALVATDGHILKVNRALCEFLGYSVGELIQMNFQKITHPDDLEADLQYVRQILAGEIQSYQMEKRYQHKLGNYLWAALSVSLVKNSAGNPLYFVSQIKDITESKRAEAEINRQLSELETLYESGLAISSLRTPKEIAQKTIEILERKMDWHHIAIRQYDHETNSIELIAFNRAGLSPFEAEEQVTKINEIISSPEQGISGWVTTHGSSLRIPQVKNDKRYVGIFPDIQSGLYVPLKIGEKVIGSIAVESKSENAFSDQDERLLLTLAGQAAIAIENANLLNQIQMELMERTLAEEEVRKLNAELEIRVQERTAEIESARQRLELATLSAGLGIWEWNINSGSMLLDDQLHQILGTTAETFEGNIKGFIDRIHEEDTPLLMNLLQEVVSGKTYYEAEYRIVRPDSSIHTIMVHGLGIQGVHGGVERMIGIVDDITEKKQAEQALHESGAYARLLFDAAPDPVSVAEMDGIMVDVNRLFEQQHRVKREQIRGKHIAELNIFPTDQIAKANEYIMAIMEGREMPPVELDFYSPSNDIHTLEMHSYPIEVNGRPLVLSTSRDITLHKRAEETLRLANAEKERALRMKDEFLASMSHELRTPLNAILGISESLEEQIIGQLNEKQLKYLRTINESGKHLLELINDILDLSKIEAGRFEINMLDVKVNHLCNSSLRMIKELAQKKNIDVLLSIDPKVMDITGDERRLKQALVNLLSNAVKFTPAGGHIGLEVLGHPKKHKITFTVWDNGIGIKKENLGRLFKPFVQLDSSLAREYAGTGLGLALVSQMVRLHGGNVGVESQPDKGSRFTITLPWKNTEANLKKNATAETEIEESRSGLQVNGKRNGKVMLVEDTESVVLMLTDFLKFMGYEVAVARNGIQAVDIVEQEKPDAILMDVMMPGMDGLEATRRIRKLNSMQKIPIIALTALAMPGDREQCIAAGMNDYLRKPVMMQDLAQVLETHIHPSKQPAIEGA